MVAVPVQYFVKEQVTKTLFLKKTRNFTCRFGNNVYICSG